ncbi:hypothetical protein Tco_1184476 [Tanacetum coccineum]
MSKEVGTPRYLSLVVPLKKVSDEAVHKELGDRMERAATTASSLEAEQDSDCKLSRFEITSKQSNDPPLSRGYTLGSGEDNMKLLELMELFTAAQLQLNDAKLNQFKFLLLRSIQSSTHLVFNSFGSDLHLDKKKLIIMKASIRSDLHLDDAEASEEVGEDSDNPTDSNQIPIVDQPSTSSPLKKKQKSKRKQRKEAEVVHDEAEHEKSEPTPSNYPLPSGEDSMKLNDLMVLCINLQKHVLDLENAKSDQAIEIASLKKRVDKLEKKSKFRTTGLKRLKKVGAALRIESSNDSLGAQEDASKQGRRIEDIDADAKVTLVNETQERQDEDLMFDIGVLDGDEMFVDATTGEKDEQSTKIDDSIAGEAVTTAGVEDSAAPTIQVSTADIRDEGVTAAKIDELILAQTLIEIKAAKPKVVITAATTTTTTRPKARGVVVQEPSEFRTSPVAKPSKSKDKGKAIMLEHVVPLKRKDQVAIDEDLARNIQAQLDEEERLERQKKEEANIALIESRENTQAMVEADRLLAERLPKKEREELTDEEKGKLFMELMDKKENILLR